jgi:hypothetical protein
MKILLRILKWLAIAVVGVVLLVIGCWYLLPDQAVDPAAAKVIARQPVPPAGQNGYFLVWGMLASRELDPHEAGQKIVAEHERIYAAKGDMAGFKPERFLGATPLTAKATRKRCEIEVDPCLPYYQVTQADYKADIAQHALLLERYRSLRGYPQFSEMVISLTASSPLPSFGPVSILSGLVDADIAIKIAYPRSRKEALDELAAEVELWRHIARDSDTLISKMVAVGVLQRKYHLASEIMQSYPEVARLYMSRLAEISAPITLQDMSMTRPLRSEFRLIAHLFSNLDHAAWAAWGGDGNEKLQSVLLRSGAFKPNASINNAWARYQDNIQLFEKSPQEAVAGRAALMERTGNVNPWAPNVLLYNPIGRVLDVEAGVDFSSYAFRLYDLVGLSRMVELQRRSIDATRPTGHVPYHPDRADLVNPYTGQPFDWDVSKGTISFIGHGSRYLKDGRVLIQADRH